MATLTINPATEGVSPFPIILRDALAASKGQTLTKFAVGSLSIEVRASDDSVWAIARRLGAGGLALRIAYVTGAYRCTKVQPEPGETARIEVTSPDRRWLYQTDLGTDQILAFPPDGVGEGSLAFGAPPGSGPRHLIFQPSRSVAFLISELASTLTVLEVDGSTLRPRECLSTLPQGFDGESLGGHIGINAAGDRLYVTNRGHDSLATFAFDGERLSLLQHVPSGGASPRFFLLLEAEKLMLVANEEGGNITGFKILGDETLEPAGLNVAIPGPSFIFAA